MRRKIHFSILVSAIAALIAISGFWGCWYDQDEENQPTGPDRTGVQGWAMYVTVTPSTVPANGSATMHVQAKFWDLEQRTGVADKAVYFSLWNIDNSPASPFELHFADGGMNTQVVTNGAGLADITIYVEYLPKTSFEKNYYIKAESTIDYDNNAVNIYDAHAIRLYNPYFDGKATPVPDDDELPVADFTFFPSSPDNCELVTFDASGSYDTNAAGEKAYDDIVSYTWFFGDGTTAYGKVVQHQYTVDGSYKVELIVYDDEGFPGSAQQTIDIAGC
jgi:PKD repeat protein